MTAVDRDAIDRVAEAAATAYMAENYGGGAWRKIAGFLLAQGHSEHEAEALMRSKHARWADDSQGHGIGKGTTSAAFARYYGAQRERGFDWIAEGRQMAAETPSNLPDADEAWA